MTCTGHGERKAEVRFFPGFISFPASSPISWRHLMSQHVCWNFRVECSNDFLKDAVSSPAWFLLLRRCRYRPTRQSQINTRSTRESTAVRLTDSPVCPPITRRAKRCRPLVRITSSFSEKLVASTENIFVHQKRRTHVRPSSPPKSISNDYTTSVFQQ